MCALLADRLKVIKPSATLGLTDRVNQLKAEGKSIINLGVGEPDFDTPEPIKTAAIAAIEAGFTKYTATSGIRELKLAIKAKLWRDNGLVYEPEQIIVSTGLKQALFNLMLATLNPGDEVIIPAPYWVSYPEMAALAGAIPVTIEGLASNDLKITAEQLRQAITPKTKMLLLNSPSNPSGMVYSLSELRSLGAVLRDYPDVLIATDDMYEKIYWGSEPFHNILNACPDLFDRTVVLNGVSKTYAMTGWRIGYAACRKELIKAMDTIQSQSTSSANSIAQKAAVAALDSPQTCVTTMRDAYQARHQFLFERMSKWPGVLPLYSIGAFYSFPDVRGLIARLGLNDDIALCEFLLNTAGVAVLPGSVFGSPGHIRLSFALSLQELTLAVERIELAIGLKA